MTKPISAGPERGSFGGTDETDDALERRDEREEERDETLLREEETLLRLCILSERREDWKAPSDV
jgi:hypothetical protein